MSPSPDAWPLRAAVELVQLGPEGLTVRQLRDAVRKAGIKPVGRMSQERGRTAPLFNPAELIAVCEGMSGPASQPAGDVWTYGKPADWL